MCIITKLGKQKDMYTFLTVIPYMDSRFVEKIFYGLTKDLLRFNDLMKGLNGWMYKWSEHFHDPVRYKSDLNITKRIDQIHCTIEWHQN